MQLMLLVAWLAGPTGEPYNTDRICIPEKSHKMLRGRFVYVGKTLTDLQIVGCEMYQNAFGVRAPTAGGAIALPRPPIAAQYSHLVTTCCRFVWFYYYSVFHCTVKRADVSWVITHSLPAALRKLPVFKLLSQGDFEIFRPAGATRCTDGCEIWHGGPDLSTPPC